MSIEKQIKKMDELYESCVLLVDELGGKVAQLQRLMRETGRRPEGQAHPEVESPQFPSPQNVVKSICDTLSQRVDEVVSDRRYQPLVEARTIATGVLKELFANTITLREIGKVLGGRDHSTVNKMLGDYNFNYFEDVEFQAKVNKCKLHLFEKYQIPIKN